jgi:branched-subunit amino acid ABC-type transport system permease component
VRSRISRSGVRARAAGSQKGFLEAKGVRVDMVDNYPFASADLTSMIVKASAFKPEAMICDSFLGNALLITRTMAEQELKPLVYATGGGGHVQPDFLADAGPLTEGIIAAVVWMPASAPRCRGSFKFAGLIVSEPRLIAFATMLVVAGALYLSFARTDLCRAIRAVGRRRECSASTIAGSIITPSRSARR